MKVLLIMCSLILAFPAFSLARVPAEKQHPRISEKKETLQIIRHTETTLQEHQQAIESEKREAEKKLTLLSSQKKKSAQASREKLKNRLKILDATLKSIKRDNKIVITALNEYQSKFGSLASIRMPGKGAKIQLLTQRDIFAIETSEAAKNALMAEIQNNKDETRLMQIVKTLIDHTRTMDDAEKEYWRNLPPSIPFEHRFRLLEILSTERQKLAALERTCSADIQQLSKRHLAEWEKVRPKGGGETKSPPHKLRRHQP